MVRISKSYPNNIQTQYDLEWDSTFHAMDTITGKYALGNVILKMGYNVNLDMPIYTRKTNGCLSSTYAIHPSGAMKSMDL
jgi:hypothetical protein